ncbi:HTH domain-containing protein [Halorientalis halophila]|uniref:HTH domain-containing protein n=1 Tax=Halorientalis halophila TaxID=3108499 RepID=UPI00300969C3
MATDVQGTRDPEREAAADSDGDRAGRHTVTVHLRTAPSGPAARRQQAVLERVRALESRDDAPEFSVERWGAQVNVPVGDTDHDAGAVDLYEEFRTAVESVDGRLEPFFETREAVGGLLSAGPPTDRTIVFPVVCLTVREDGDLTGLYPHWSDGAHHSVEDGLAALAAGATGANLC